MEEKLTAQQWATMNAEANASAIVQKNKELLTEMIQQLDSISRRVDINQEKRYWRLNFISASLAGGYKCDQAIDMSDYLIEKLFKGE